MRQRSRYRYIVVGMVLVIMTMNYIDRGALAYAQHDIVGEFGLTADQWGSLQGFFGYGYIFGGLLGGFLNDKKGPRFMWLASVLLWSVCVALTAFAGDIGIAVFGGSAMAGFLVVRVLFGFSEGPSFVTMSRTIANWAAPRERAFASSITLIGSPLGSLITAPLAAALILVTSWRTSFVILGVFGVVWSMVFARIFTNRPEQNRHVRKSELAAIRHDTAPAREVGESRWYDFFRNPSYLLNTVGFFAISYILFMLLTWTPKYLQDIYGVSLSSMSWMGMIPWIGPILTTPLGGKLADLVAARTGRLRLARNSVAFVSLLLSGICFVSIPLTDSLGGVLTMMSLGNSFALMSNSIYWSNLIDIDPSKTGTFAGIMHFLGQTAATLAPTLTGYLVAKGGYNAAFVLAGMVCLSGMVCVSFIRFDRHTTASQTPADASVS